MYKNGYGVKQDYFEAVKYYKLAADQGDSSAQFNLGIMYDNGLGVKQDRIEAKRLYGLACDNRNENGCKYYKLLNEAGY
jgi:TPR repeat protein